MLAIRSGRKGRGIERETCDSVLPTETGFWSLLRFDDSTMMTFLPLEECGTSGEDGQKMSIWRIAGSSQHLLVNKRMSHFFGGKNIFCLCGGISLLLRRRQTDIIAVETGDALACFISQSGEERGRKNASPCKASFLPLPTLFHDKHGKLTDPPPLPPPVPLPPANKRLLNRWLLSESFPGLMGGGEKGGGVVKTVSKT